MSKKPSENRTSAVVDTILNNLLKSLEAQIKERVLDPTEQLVTYATVMSNLGGDFIEYMESKFGVDSQDTISEFIEAYKYFKGVRKDRHDAS